MKHKKTTTWRTDQEVIDWLRSIAMEKDRSMNWVMNEIIKEKMDKQVKNHNEAS